jgi:hypothetical protein
MVVVSNFVNEIDNRIRIRIKKHRGTGTNAKTGEVQRFDGVNFCIIGPSSTSENIVTLKEAEELYECLKRFLEK